MLKKRMPVTQPRIRELETIGGSLDCGPGDVGQKEWFAHSLCRIDIPISFSRNHPFDSVLVDFEAWMRLLDQRFVTCVN